MIGGNGQMLPGKNVEIYQFWKSQNLTENPPTILLVELQRKNGN